jgi:hypothetical protein
LELTLAGFRNAVEHGTGKLIWQGYADDGEREAKRREILADYNSRILSERMGVPSGIGSPQAAHT